jgi:hypothetical protein
MKIKDFNNRVMTNKDLLIQQLDYYDLNYFLNDKDGIIIFYHCKDIPKTVLELISKCGYSLQTT